MLQKKINRCVRKFEVMVLKGTYVAPNKSQQSSARENRAEPSKTRQSDDAGNEIKAKQTHSSCHLTLCRLVAQ